MNSKLLFTMATCLAPVIAASVAFAQGTPDNGSSDQPSTKAKAPSKGASTVELSTEEPAGESSATMKAVVPSSPLGNFTLTLMNETEFNKSSITDKDVDTTGLNRVQLGYKLTDTKLLSVREDFTFSLKQNENPDRKSNDGHINDPFIAYTDTKLAVLPGDWTLTMQARYYIPIGESDRFVSKALGSDALLLIFDKSVGKFDYEIFLLGQYYNNTQDYSYTGAGVAKANRDWTAYPAYGEVAYNINEKVSVMHDSALVTEAFRSAPGVDYKRKNTFYNETYLSFSPTKTLTLMASIEDDAVLESNNAVRMYQDADILYNLYVKFKL